MWGAAALARTAGAEGVGVVGAGRVAVMSAGGGGPGTSAAEE